MTAEFVPLFTKKNQTLREASYTEATCGLLMIFLVFLSFQVCWLVCFSLLWGRNPLKPFNRRCLTTAGAAANTNPEYLLDSRFSSLISQKNVDFPRGPAGQLQTGSKVRGWSRLCCQKKKTLRRTQVRMKTELCRLFSRPEHVGRDVCLSDRRIRNGFMFSVSPSELPLCTVSLHRRADLWDENELRERRTWQKILQRGERWASPSLSGALSCVCIELGSELMWCNREKTVLGNTIWVCVQGFSVDDVLKKCKNGDYVTVEGSVLHPLSVLDSISSSRTWKINNTRRKKKLWKTAFFSCLIIPVLLHAAELSPS